MRVCKADKALLIKQEPHPKSCYCGEGTFTISRLEHYSLGGEIDDKATVRPSTSDKVCEVSYVG